MPVLKDWHYNHLNLIVIYLPTFKITSSASLGISYTKEPLIFNPSLITPPRNFLSNALGETFQASH